MEYLVSCPSDFNKQVLLGEKTELAGLWSSTQHSRVCSCGQHGDVGNVWPSMQLSGSPFLGKGTARPCVLLGGRFSHNSMPAEALLHGKVLPQPACWHTKGRCSSWKERIWLWRLNTVVQLGKEQINLPSEELLGAAGQRGGTLTGCNEWVSDSQGRHRLSDRGQQLQVPGGQELSHVLSHMP
ncbi:unnamed protein product [Rangifer tarandus platyrhynchus]|uniref:Uncharacterized protein n=1 Tax=Rangifer tarandus platyrhynchus TaxID=3082113 RepID=A0ACB1MK65_RANTA